MTTHRQLYAGLLPVRQSEQDAEYLRAAIAALGSALAALVRVHGPEAGVCDALRDTVRACRDETIDALQRQTDRLHSPPAVPAESKQR